MDIQHLTLAYAAAILVALGVTASFSAAISQMLFRLLQEDIAPIWSRFVRFALFAAAVAGGMPARTGVFIDRSALPPPPPTSAEGLMLVMNSAIGSLMAASWFLLLFFGATLTALTAGRAYAAAQKRREEEAREAARRGEQAKREEEKPAAQEKKPELASPQRRH